MSQTEAGKYNRLVAEQGHAVAQCNYGICLANGEGVSKNQEEVMKYYQLAADQGDAYAQYIGCLTQV
jgi:TPR repeat protein